MCRPCCLQHGIKQRRSGGVTAIAVLNIILGSVGLLSVCTSVWLLLMPAFLATAEIKIMMSIPEYRVSVIIGAIATPVISFFLLMCGVGLLRLSDWARKGSIVYAIIVFVLTVVGVVFYFGWVYPAMETAGISPSRVITAKIGSAVGWLLGCGYAIVLLLLLTRPMIKVQFGHQIPSGAPGGIPMPHDGTKK